MQIKEKIEVIIEFFWRDVSFRFFLNRMYLIGIGKKISDFSIFLHNLSCGLYVPLIE
jgi:hypothetical protein